MGMSPVMSGFASNDLQSKSTPERVAAAAKEFEAVLIEQMLKEARTSSGLSEEQDQASATLREIADQQFARLIASNGGLGVTKVLLESLKERRQRCRANGPSPGRGGDSHVGQAQQDLEESFLIHQPDPADRTNARRPHRPSLGGRSGRGDTAVLLVLRIGPERHRNGHLPLLPHDHHVDCPALTTLAQDRRHIGGRLDALLIHAHDHVTRFQPRLFGR